jgi:hypothetical protein
MSAEALDILRSIDHSLKQLLKVFQKAQPKPVASDRDLDSQYGDPLLRFMPRDWTGGSYKGRRYSECPPDLLDLVADTMDYFAQKAEAANELTDRGKPVAEFKRADAARARGWAKRMRAGRTPALAANGNGNDAPASEWDQDSGF